MLVPDNQWLPMSTFSKRGDQSVYTLINTGGSAPTIEVSGDGGATAITLTDASVADIAVDLVLSRDTLIRAQLNGAVVSIT